MSRGVAIALVLLAAPLVAAAQSLPDPTEPTTRIDANRSAAAPAAWVLRSTLISDTRRVAVVNDETVSVGDSVDGARVVSIEPYSVRLRVDGRVIELNLTADDPKRRAAGGVD